MTQEEQIETLIRDACDVMPMVKSDARNRLKSIIQADRDMILEEINRLKTKSEKFVPFQKIHYQEALENVITIINK